MTTVPVKRILCPTDFSEPSRRAFVTATSFARWFEADLTVLHVVPGVPATALLLSGTPVPIPLQPNARQGYLEALGGMIGPARGAGVAAGAELREGDPVREILRLADSLPADLIVLGTHGYSGFERLVLGSVTEKVLRKATCPVATIPHPPGFTPTEELRVATVLCPVDLSASTPLGLEMAATLAKKAEATLLVLHVLEHVPDEDPRALMHFNMPEYRSFLEVDARERLHETIPAAVRSSCRVEELIETGRAYREILRVAAERRADLIVMGIQGRTALDLMIFGSTAQHIVRQAACPVLTVRLSR